MSFGSTLYSLRKNKNLSQEALATELNTTRQAVSKWENDQGFPEMDKLLMLSSFFGVTVDYLLKGEDALPDGRDEVGYYASGETIERFLIYERRTVKSIALGVFLVLMSGSAFLLFPASPMLYTVIASVLILAGAASIVAACLRENSYKKITSEPLLMDHKYLAELRNRYVPLKKRYAGLFIGGIGLGAVSLVITVILEDVLHLGEGGFHVISLLLFSASVYAVIYAAVIIWAYGVVTDNGEYMKKRGTGKKTESVWHVNGIIAVCVVALAFIYIITGGSGHIAEWIDKFASKL